MKRCQQSDFGEDKYDREFYKSWGDIDMILCADFHGHLDDQWTLRGSVNNYREERHEIEFKVDRCNNANLKPGEPPCASDQEINEFLHDFEISSWVIQE